MQNANTAREAVRELAEPYPRIALLTPYTGGNLGDAVIQDSMIANLRRRMPNAQFLGITLGCDNFLKQHGTGAFPLLASAMPVSNRPRGWAEGVPSNRVKRLVRRVPGLVPLLKIARGLATRIFRETLHSFKAYRLLRTQDLLLISGGGQLDDEWGGPWEFPFALWKWALLARLARVPCAAASVGACKISSTPSRVLLSLTLRMCCYRSYREAKTKAIAASLLPRAKNDSVVPDLAFSLPDSEFPSPVGSIRKIARGRPVIALSPISYGKPGNWPTPNHAVHDRYLHQLARVLSCLPRRGYFVIVVCSSLGDDESVIPDLLAHLGNELKQSLDEQIHFPTIRTWRDLVAVLREADYLIASRLHGTILGFMTQTPTVAISFDPKVDWVMEDLLQTDYLLHIRDFTAEGVLDALDRIKLRREAVVDQIVSYRTSALFTSARQYDTLAKLVPMPYQSHN